MKESQTVWRDINSFSVSRFCIAHLQARWWRRFRLQESCGVHSNRLFYALQQFSQQNL